MSVFVAEWDMVNCHACLLKKKNTDIEEVK